MVGVAVGGWWAWRRDPGAGGDSRRRNLWLLAALQTVLAASPLLLYAALSQLGRVTSARGQGAATAIVFPGLALAAGLLGGFQFLVASRAYFGSEPEGGRSPGLLYALDLVGACAGALALSGLLLPVYGFLCTAALMASMNLAPAVMAAAAGWKNCD